MDCWNTPLNLQTGCSGPTTSFPTPWTTCASWPALLQPRRLATVSIHSAARQIQHHRSEEHTSELQSPCNLVCRLLLEKKKKTRNTLHCKHHEHRVYVLDSVVAGYS